MTSPVRSRSTFSFSRGVSHVEALVKTAAALGHDRLGLADRSSVAGHVQLLKSSREHRIIPMFGAELLIAPPSSWSRRPLPSGWVTVFLQDDRGFRNLSSLLGRVPLGSDTAIPLDALQAAAEGLLLLSGNRADGLLPRLLRQDMDAARNLASALHDTFGDRALIEVERGGGQEADPRLEAALLDLALSPERPMPLIATTPIWFATPDRRDAWSLSRCVALDQMVHVDQDGNARLPALPEPADAIPSADQLTELFADLPEALRNAREIFERCAYAPELRPASLPILHDLGTSPEVALRQACERGLAARLHDDDLADKSRDYVDRLDFELDVISRTGFASYYLIVAEYVSWAKSRDIPVGPGRGSGVGSLAAWSLGITDIDPLRHDLLFERFLNPERVSPPDFDIDFCERRRDEVLAHIVERYGAEHVGAISTFAGIRIKTAVKDVSRILVHADGHPLPFHEINAITKLIPSGPQEPETVEKALEDIPALRNAADKDPRIATTLRYAGLLQGMYRQNGTHAAGVVIADAPIRDRAPMHPASAQQSSAMPQIGLDMKGCEAQGLVKFDILGLAATTLLRYAERLLEKLGTPPPDWRRLDLDDPEILDAFAQGDTFGVFQFESQGMRNALREVKPSRFSDLVAINALFRPGPMRYIAEFAARKAGESEFDYPPPADRTRPILEETYGIMVYQEQVMRIAQVCAGYSLGAADVLRRAMGKKDAAEMEAQRRIFLHGDGKDIPGALALGLSPEEARRLVDDIEAFAGYGFNKSHAVAYSHLAWRTMWLKVHHPEAFHAALMSCHKGDAEKLAEIFKEVVQRGIPLLAPDIATAIDDFGLERDVDGRVAIRFGLDGVRNIGTSSAFVAARNSLARPTQEALADLVVTHFTARQIESLAAAGAFDGWTPNRRRALEAILAWKARPRETTQDVLTPNGADTAGGALFSLVPDIPDWEDRRERERKAVGGNFGRHPIMANRDLLFAFGVRRLSSYLDHMKRRTISALRNAKLAILVTRTDVRLTRKKARMLIVGGSEFDDAYEVLFFENDRNSDLELLRTMAEAARRNGEPLVATADISLDHATQRLLVRGSRLHTMLDVAMAVPGWFVAHAPSGFALPEATSKDAGAAPDARHHLLVLRAEDPSAPKEIFPADRALLAALRCAQGVELVRVSQERYEELRTARHVPSEPAAA